jgi:hypothetical protein
MHNAFDKKIVYVFYEFEKNGNKMNSNTIPSYA